MRNKLTNQLIRHIMLLGDMMGDFDLEKFIFSVKHILKRRMKKIDEQLVPYGISGCHASYLLLMYDSDSGFTMAELSKETLVDKAMISRVVKELENKNYVVKTNEKVRNFKIILTNEGEKVALFYKNILEDLKNKTFDKFTLSEIGELKKCASLLIDRLKEKEE